MIDKFQKQAIAELPKKFWIIRDTAVEHVLSNSPLPASLVDLQEWLATDGWDDLLSAWINEDVALNLKQWVTYKFSDSTLRDTDGLEEAEAITDRMRVDFARAAISYAVENSEGDDSPSVHSFPMEREDGARAVLGCTVEIRGHDHMLFIGTYARLGFYSTVRPMRSVMLKFWRCGISKRRRPRYARGHHPKRLLLCASRMRRVFNKKMCHLPIPLQRERLHQVFQRQMRWVLSV